MAVGPELFFLIMLIQNDIGIQYYPTFFIDYIWIDVDFENLRAINNQVSEFVE